MPSKINTKILKLDLIMMWRVFYPDSQEASLSDAKDVKHVQVIVDHMYFTRDILFFLVGRFIIKKY